ncbi:hypothetical protein [Leptospira interrogans]|uniref:hypothetical protein n=2 Tax=Leptospira interrogans TaxID=173 RepID=UPI000361E929|nr:hypothetical protein [Leptospira interrogans]UMQ60534.1 hypothetical protein FH585_21085 [Leptospira interrogans]
MTFKEDQQMSQLKKLISESSISLLSLSVNGISLDDVMRVEKQKANVKESRARLRALFVSYRQTIRYLKGQVKERDEALMVLRAETDAMADVLQDVKKSYRVDEVA